MSKHHRGAVQHRLAVLRPIVKATLPAPCVQLRCRLGGVVHPGQRWHVGHLPGRDQSGMPPGWLPTLADVGPAHEKCNTSDGGKLGRALQLKAKADERRMPRW